VIDFLWGHKNWQKSHFVAYFSKRWVKHYLPGISTVFLTTPVKFSGRLIQFIGRALRPAPEKGRAVMFDFVDVLKGSHSCLLLTEPWIKMQSNMP